MNIISKEKTSSGVVIYTISKDMTDIEVDKRFSNKFVNSSMIKHIIDYDADVYTLDKNTNEKKLLLKFRKNALIQKHAQAFYDNVIKFSLTPTANRGSTTGSKTKNVYDNPKVMSNIFGFP